MFHAEAQINVVEKGANCTPTAQRALLAQQREASLAETSANKAINFRKQDGEETSLMENQAWDVMTERWQH